MLIAALVVGVVALLFQAACALPLAPVGASESETFVASFGHQLGRRRATVFAVVVAL